MNKEEFVKRISKLGINLTEEQIKQLEIYKDFLIEYNKHTNLTTIIDDEDIYLKHFYDSLTIYTVNNYIDINNIKKVIDVGTGAGFPGMVIKIAFPNLDVTLLDSNNKKTKFLDELINKLGLSNVRTTNERSEEYALSHLEEYDLVTSRAVANLRVLTELCLPMVKENGYFVPLKANVEEEIKESEKILNILHGKIEEVKTFNLPIEESIRNIVVIKKEGKTPSGYPRNYSKIKKG